MKRNVFIKKKKKNTTNIFFLTSESEVQSIQKSDENFNELLKQNKQAKK